MRPEKSRNGRTVLELGIFSFFVNILLLAVPLYMLQVYDRILPASNINTLIYISIFAAGALLLLGILEMVRGVIALRAAVRLDVDNTRDAMQAALRSPRADIGDVQPLRDLATLRSFVASRAVFALFDLPFAPLFIALLWFVHPLLFWTTAGGAVFLLAIAVLNQWMTVDDTRIASRHALAEMNLAQALVRNSETLRALGMTENALAVWTRLHVPVLEKNDGVGRFNAVFVGISRFARMGLQIAVLGLGAWLVLEKEITAGMIFASSIIAGRGLQPLDQVIGGWRQFVDVRAAWRRFQTATGSLERRRDYIDLPEPKGQIEVDKLLYLPPQAKGDTEPVLKRISARIGAGSVVGIIGPSGAGKSTLARLIVGAIHPTAGLVKIDGTDIRNWDPLQLGRHIGYLPQDVEILPGTVAQNIARFDQAASDADIIDAARRANVHELVLSLPEGYNTVIGPMGMSLSGGQRQRIGLACAFYGRPRLLVLDEPNAHLDQAGDAALEAAIDNARNSRATVLIITQRIPIVRKVDGLLVMKHGSIEEFGPRDEVLARYDGRKPATRSKESDAAPDATVARRATNPASANTGGDAAGKSEKRPIAAGHSKSPFSAFGPNLSPSREENER